MNRIFRTLKEYWIIISFLCLSVPYMLLVSAYTNVFSGNFSLAVDYVNSNITQGKFNIIMMFLISCFQICSMLIVPVYLTEKVYFRIIYNERNNMEYSKKELEIRGGKWGIKYPKIQKGVEPKWYKKIGFFLIVYILSVMVSLVPIFFFALVLGGYYRMLVFVLGIFDVFCVFIICFLTIHSSSGVMLLAGLTLVITVNLGYPQMPAYILNYSGYSPSHIYCLSGYVKDYDNANETLKIKNINALQISYDSRGVQVFTGEYDNSTKTWKNEGENGIHREYLQFERGYKVTSGVCESGSSSVHPPQGQ